MGKRVAAIAAVAAAAGSVAGLLGGQQLHWFIVFASLLAAASLIPVLGSRLALARERALAVPTDVSRREDVERLGKQAVAEFGRIDVWINNAGVGALGPFERIPLELHEQVIRTDLLGTLYGSHVAYRQFLEQGRGTLINVSSELGRHTVPYYTSYAAAKHGVVGLGDALRQEIEQILRIVRPGDVRQSPDHPARSNEVFDGG